jgi:hypothetical protein
LAWSFSSQKGDGLFNPQDSLTSNGERKGGKRLEQREDRKLVQKISKWLEALGGSGKTR